LLAALMGGGAEGGAPPPEAGGDGQISMSAAELGNLISTIVTAVTGKFPQPPKEEAPAEAPPEAAAPSGPPAPDAPGAAVLQAAGNV